MEKLFKLKEHGTDVKTEVIAGVTTFMTMAYILAVNPNMLSATGMDAGAVFTATALSSAIASFIMAFAANLPFVLSAGMGLNAYFAYTVCIGMGLSWEIALTAVFVEGIVFIILSLTNVREAIFNAIPSTLKIAVSVGIGLFICFIGLQNAHLIVLNESTKVAVFSLSGSLKGGSFSSEGITVLLAFIGILITAILLIKQVKGNILIGILITGILVIKNIKGNILWGILITWLLGIVCQLAGLYVPNGELGFYSLLPDFSNEKIQPLNLKLQTKEAENYANTLGSIATAIQSVGAVFSTESNGMLQYFANIVSGAAQAATAISALIPIKKAEANANMEAAATGVASSVAGIPFVGAIMAVSAVASLVAAMATIPQFAEGGIVGGSSFFGDKLLARVNSGEMILNRDQQRTLYSLTETDRAASVNIGFDKVRGSDIYLSLSNYMKKTGKKL